jgi:hypothetical protein
MEVKRFGRKARVAAGFVVARDSPDMFGPTGGRTMAKQDTKTRFHKGVMMPNDWPCGPHGRNGPDPP